MYGDTEDNTKSIKEQLQAANPYLLIGISFLFSLIIVVVLAARSLPHKQKPSFSKLSAPRLPKQPAVRQNPN